MPTHDDPRTALILKEMVRRLDEESRRLRSVEQRIDALETRVKSTEDNYFMKLKKLDQSMAALEAKTLLMDDSIVKARLLLDKFSKTLEKTAKKTDLKELEKMFELLTPVNGDVSQEKKRIYA